MNRKELRLLAKVLRERDLKTKDLTSASVLTDLAMVALDMADQLPPSAGDEPCDDCGAEWVHYGQGSKTMQHILPCANAYAPD